MCWMCHEQSASSYRACDGCSALHDKSELQVYDIIREWGHLAEWIECKKGVSVFCANCRDAMDAYRESMRQHASETEPYVWYHYGNRDKDAKFYIIPVGILGSDNGRDKTMGIRCAQIKYGVEAVAEILQGFVYKDDDGLRIKRLTIEDVDETVRCDKCWLRLYECNAREVTR